jgi:hypothetical protein
MPRIELKPQNWDESPAAIAGDGAPTIDVCRDCAGKFEEGEAIPDYVVNELFENNLPFDEDTAVTSTDAEHPTFGDEDYECASCCKPLDSSDD